MNQGSLETAISVNDLIHESFSSPTVSIPPIQPEDDEDMYLPASSIGNHGTQSEDEEDKHKNFVGCSDSSDGRESEDEDEYVTTSGSRS
jgi:hypothetical protein